MRSLCVLDARSWCYSGESAYSLLESPKFYAFSLFSIEGILLVAYWSAQPRLLLLEELLVGFLVLLRPEKDLRITLQETLPSPVGQLVADRLSGKHSRVYAPPETLSTSVAWLSTCCKNNTTQYLRPLRECCYQMFPLHARPGLVPLALGNWGG